MEQWRVALRDARKRSSMSQRDLAARSRVSPDSIKAYEQGVRTPRRETLLRLLRALSIGQRTANRILEDAGFARERGSVLK